MFVYKFAFTQEPNENNIYLTGTRLIQVFKKCNLMYVNNCKEGRKC